MSLRWLLRVTAEFAQLAAEIASRMVGRASASSCLRSRPPRDALRERLVYNIPLLARHVKRRASHGAGIAGFGGFTDADGVAAERRRMWMICEAACDGTVVASIGTAQIVPTFSCVLGNEAVTPPGKRHRGRLCTRLGVASSCHCGCRRSRRRRVAVFHQFCGSSGPSVTAGL
ncbi:hypothetical protein EDB85DRAFT_1937238 [Lactarius pseudohatsudake]|nr:hypothetical protein EDB85DRAFT_2014592 [Lactarius pseudohatsudake]KAH9037228.1 hypothetical protein EDB85DRAFT_1937238 [Lactarius pseudohatsudake]